jgi:hypothetical protein
MASWGIFSWGEGAWGNQGVLVEVNNPLDVEFVTYTDDEFTVVFTVELPTTICVEFARVSEPSANVVVLTTILAPIVIVEEFVNTLTVELPTLNDVELTPTLAPT